MVAAGVNDLLARIRAEMTGAPEEVPEGWMTSHQWAEQWGMKISNTKLTIQAGVRHGLMETKRFRIISNGKRYMMPHYREV